MYGTDGLHELLQISDYVVVAVALTEETEGMLGAEQFAHSKKGQILINVARGPVIVEDDLVEALTSGNIAGAALDVFCEEPLPKTSKFWDLENVLLSPHNADQLVDFRHKSVQFFCENVSRYIADLPLRNIISARNGY
jgi:phosphoglycerate dehydrogenase-like enzyme